MNRPERVVARFLQAMEHDSPEALKQYLKDHPSADPKNHTVKKQDGGGSSGGSPKKYLDSAKKVFDLVKPGKDLSEKDLSKRLRSMEDAAGGLREQVEELKSKVSPGEYKEMKDVAEKLRGTALSAPSRLFADEGSGPDPKKMVAPSKLHDFENEAWDSINKLDKLLKKHG